MLYFGQYNTEVSEIKKKKGLKREQILDKNIRLNPEDRPCPNFDQTGITLQKCANSKEMGMRVVDDCAEAHEM